MSQRLLQVSAACMNSQVDMRVDRHVDGHVEVSELWLERTEAVNGVTLRPTASGLVEAPELSELEGQEERQQRATLGLCQGLPAQRLMAGTKAQASDWGPHVPPLPRHTSRQACPPQTHLPQD